MDIPNLKTSKKPKNTGMRVLAAFALVTVLIPTSALSRQMVCKYDYITHVTTLHLDDMGLQNGSISYGFEHSVSPVGGEEMFLFRKRGSSRLTGTGQFNFIAENLFFDSQGIPSSILFVDFGRPALKELQFPATVLEQSLDMLSTPLVVWSCHRTD